MQRIVRLSFPDLDFEDDPEGSEPTFVQIQNPKTLSAASFDATIDPGPDPFIEEPALGETPEQGALRLARNHERQRQFTDRVNPLFLEAGRARVAAIIHSWNVRDGMTGAPLGDPSAATVAQAPKVVYDTIMEMLNDVVNPRKSQATS